MSVSAIVFVFSWYLRINFPGKTYSSLNALCLNSTIPDINIFSPAFVNYQSFGVSLFINKSSACQDKFVVAVSLMNILQV